MATFQLILPQEVGSLLRANAPLPDIAVLCRIVEPPAIVSWVRQLQRAGVAVLYEIDDHLLELPPTSPDYAVHQEPVLRGTLIQLLRWVDGITVTTAALRDGLIQYNPRIHVLPNCVDLSVFNAPIQQQGDTPVVIGYVGTRTHAEDFAPVVPAIKRLANDLAEQVIFRFLNFIPEELRGVAGIEFVDGHPDHRQFAKMMQASGFHVGLAPLVDNPFNRCKSDMKYLEYGSLGVPGIYAAVHPYLDTIRDGLTGQIVQPHSAEAWYRAIAWMVTHPAERRRMGDAAYRQVTQTRTLQGNLQNWNAVYRAAIVERRSQGALSSADDPTRRELEPVSPVLLFEIEQNKNSQIQPTGAPRLITPWHRLPVRAIEIFWRQGPAALLQRACLYWRRIITSS